jgi:hypothetical protein
MQFCGGGMLSRDLHHYTARSRVCQEKIWEMYGVEARGNIFDLVGTMRQISLFRGDTIQGTS